MVWVVAGIDGAREEVDGPAVDQAGVGDRGAGRTDRDVGDAIGDDVAHRRPPRPPSAPPGVLFAKVTTMTPGVAAGLSRSTVWWCPSCAATARAFSAALV